MKSDEHKLSASLTIRIRSQRMGRSAGEPTGENAGHEPCRDRRHRTAALGLQQKRGMAAVSDGHSHEETGTSSSEHPKASATRSRVLSCGVEDLLSRRAIAGWVRFDACASCCWVRPKRRRCSISRSMRETQFSDIITHPHHEIVGSAYGSSGAGTLCR